jgi:hypothetical protein
MTLAKRLLSKLFLERVDPSLAFDDLHVPLALRRNSNRIIASVL